MKRLSVAVVCLIAFAEAAFGETVVAARTVRSQSVLTSADVTLADTVPGDWFTDVSDVIGKETRVTLYQGRPIRRGDVGPPAVVRRNQIVTLIYSSGALTITTDARALGRAAVGERIKAMNLASRNTVIGTVDSAGNIVVSDRIVNDFRQEN